MGPEEFLNGWRPDGDRTETTDGDRTETKWKPDGDWMDMEYHLFFDHPTRPLR